MSFPQILRPLIIIALVAVVPKDKLTIKGPVKKYEGKGSSGNSVWRLFCSECGSPIAHDPDAAPEIIAIKAGTLDSEIKKNLKPVRAFAFLPNTMYKADVAYRIPRSGLLESSLSARRTLPSHSSTCLSNFCSECLSQFEVKRWLHRR